MDILISGEMRSELADRQEAHIIDRNHSIFYYTRHLKGQLTLRVQHFKVFNAERF